VLKEVKGVWLPETEEHMKAFAKVDGWCYQGEKFIACLPYIRKFDIAVDVGAHCGLWSRQMALAFGKIYAFEPVPLHREAFVKNVPEGKYELFPFACGDKDGMVKIKTNPPSSGDANIDPDGDVEARVVRIDDVLNTPCDFLKIDTEGYEEFVLMGAERLLEYKPCVIVEQKPKKAQKYGLQETGAVKMLRKLGAVQRKVITGDYIMSWNE
jgi:FkbM family methyltransferase